MPRRPRFAPAGERRRPTASPSHAGEGFLSETKSDEPEPPGRRSSATLRSPCSRSTVLLDAGYVVDCVSSVQPRRRASASPRAKYDLVLTDGKLGHGPAAAAVADDAADRGGSKALRRHRLHAAAARRIRLGRHGFLDEAGAVGRAPRRGSSTPSAPAESCPWPDGRR